MDDENKQEQGNNGENTEAKPENSEVGQSGSGPRVHIFGAEINGDEWARHGSETKEEWRKRKQEWKAAHREHIEQKKEQWKANRDDCHDDRHHGGGIFWGMIVLFVGVIALLYTLGFVSHGFWHVIIPFWPILLILWGASIILGRHWFARFVLFVLALAILIAIVLYGLAKSDSTVVSWLSPTVVRAIQTAQTK